MAVESIEKKVIGFCLKDVAFLSKALNVLDKSYFHKSDYRRLFEFIRKYYVKFRTVPSPQVLQDTMRKRKAKQTDILYFTNLYTTCQALATIKGDFDYYLTELKRYQHLQWMKQALEDNNQRAGILSLLEKKKDPTSAWALMKQVGIKIEVNQAGDATIRDDIHVTANEFLKQYDDEKTGNIVVKGVLTGFEHIDTAVGGLEDGQMLLVAGRPGFGKSTVVLCMARNMYLGIGKQLPLDVLLISLEMSHEQYRGRWEASIGQLSESRLRSRTLDVDEYVRFKANIEKEKTWPTCIRIVDTTSFNAFSLEEEIEHFIQACGRPPGVIVIDYLGIMNSIEKQKSDNETQARIVEETRAVGRRKGIPIVSAVQINRDRNKDKEKSTQRLSRSDIIGATADVILQITDENNEDNLASNFMNFYFIKNRNGRANFGFQMHKNFEIMDISDVTQISVDAVFDNMVGNIDKQIASEKDLGDMTQIDERQYNSTEVDPEISALML